MALTMLSIDGHVHLYPVFDLARAIEIGRRNLLDLSAQQKRTDVIPVWFLAERSDTDMFSEFRDMAEKKIETDGFTFELIDPVSVAAKKKGEVALYIFAGRQLITAENLEVLSLISDFNLADRSVSLMKTVDLILENGGIPALNWAPGKWFLSRGKVVEKAILENEPQKFFIGDSTMRNSLWPTPRLVKKAKKRGFLVLAGSDPLPFSGEEKIIGSYGFLIEGNFSPENPSASLKKMIFQNRTSIRITGKRNNPFTFAARQYQIMKEKKTRNN